MSTWRSWNEGTADLARERRLADAVCRARRCSAVKLSPMLYRVDYSLTRGGDVVAWAEMKVRNRKYPTLLLSASKWWAMQDLMHKSGKPALLYIAWPDGLWELNCAAIPMSLPVTIGGNSRGQNGDEEPVVMLPSDAFKRFSDEVISLPRAERVA